MITITVPFDNPLNQKTYENIINSLQFHQLQCTCGHSGCLTIHGYYTRSLKKDDSGIPLSICRVRCSHCGRTHALLPSLLVPYSQVSLQDQISIISSYEASGDYEEIMAGTPSVDENHQQPASSAGKAYHIILSWKPSANCTRISPGFCSYLWLAD